MEKMNMPVGVCYRQ